MGVNVARKVSVSVEQSVHNGLRRSEVQHSESVFFNLALRSAVPLALTFTLPRREDHKNAFNGCLDRNW